MPQVSQIKTRLPCYQGRVCAKSPDLISPLILSLSKDKPLDTGTWFDKLTMSVFCHWRGLCTGPVINAPFLCNPFFWYIMPSMKSLSLLTLALLAAMVLAGCGSAASEFSTAPDSAMAMPASAPAAAAMLQEVRVEREVVQASEPMTESSAAADQLKAEFVPSFEEVQASVSAQNRIIVRTVGMSIVVSNIPGTVDRIGDVAREFGGWMVSTDRGSIHYGQVSVRVPAQVLDDAVKRIRGLAVEVEAESSTSQDVTDEYVDSNSRLRSLRATEESLLNLLDRAEDVEDALRVQRELVELQAEIESLVGRIKFLEQTAAFSLVNVDLSLAPQTMAVDSGPDQTFSAGQGARFRANFTPPAGIEDFSFTWDFGDGTEPAFGTGSAPTTQPGQRVTATVNHVYDDDRDSPYIVQLDITGTGPAGLVKGSDTLIATVTRVPTIEVFAGEYRVVEEGKDVEYSGSFTRPEGLWDIQYRWDFGDGSATITGIPEEGATRAVATHSYENHRPQPYEVTLTVTAQSDAGEVKGSSSFKVVVDESKGLVIAGWSAGNTAKTATRALSGVVQAVGSLLIWLAIFSPVWLALIGIAYGLFRLRRRFRRGNPPGIGSYSGLASQEAPPSPEESEPVDAPAPDERQE